MLATCAGLEAERAAAVESVRTEVATWRNAVRRLEAAVAAERARADAATARAARAEEVAAAATAEAAASAVPSVRSSDGAAAAPPGEVARLRAEVDALRAELAEERQRTSLMADGAAALRSQIKAGIVENDVGTAGLQRAAASAGADAAELVALRCALEAERARADAAAAREAAAAQAARRGAAAAATDAPRAAELALALAAEQARSRQLAAALAAAGGNSMMGASAVQLPLPRVSAPPPALVAASAMLASATERAAGAVATRGAAVAGALRRGIGEALSAAADGNGGASLAQLASGQHAAQPVQPVQPVLASAVLRRISMELQAEDLEAACAAGPCDAGAPGLADDGATAEEAVVASTPRSASFGSRVARLSGTAAAPMTPGESSEDDDEQRYEH